MRPTVVFLHGHSRTHRSLSRLRRIVGRAGYPTWAASYPSRRAGLAELADRLSGQIREDVGDRPLFAVTHSLGGVLVRFMHERLRFQGAVMLAPPSRGSRVALTLSRNPLFRLVYGRAGMELGAPDSWPPPPRPCGVIAGSSGPSLTSPPSWVIAAVCPFPPGTPSDGTLAVDETRFDGMTDFMTLPANHTWIMRHRLVEQEVLHFLAHGRFGHSDR